MINLIFDLDGCLIDSSEVQKAALSGAYREVVGDSNYPSYKEYIKYTGDSVDNVMKKLQLPSAMADVFRRISSESVEKIVVNWDAIALVEECRNKGCMTAICTGKDHNRTLDIFRHYGLEKYFDYLICADDVDETKPSPKPILKAIELFGCSKDDVIVIGDGYNDILSAKNAGVQSVLTLWYSDSNVVWESDYTVKSIEELRKLLYKKFDVVDRSWKQ